MTEENKSVKNFPNYGSVPKLRFPGFNDEWEERYISEVISSKSKKYNPENSDFNYPSIELESLSQDSGELLSTFDSKNQKSIKNIFNTGDVLFGKLRPYLKKYYLADFDGVCSSEIWVLKSSILDSNYLYAFVQSNSFILLTEISSGSKMPRADWNLVSSSSIVYPSNPDERKKIGELIQLINSRIQTQKKIIEQLETLMKASREKIFSQKLRFKNENDDFYSEWRSTKLKNISQIFDGTHQTPKYVKKGVPFYSVENVTANNFSVTKYISEEVFIKENNRVKIEKGDILMTRIGDIGTVKYIDWNVNASFYVSLALIKSNNDNNSKYLAQYISSDKFQNELWNKTIHVAFPKKINLGEIGECLLKIPCIEEQTKIANFLSSIQDKIETEKQILEKLELQKKFLLTNLFV